MPYAKRVMNWQKKERTKRKEVAAFVIGASLVFLCFPIIFFLATPFFDQLLRPVIGNWLDLLALVPYPWDLGLAVVVGLIGLLYGLWSVVAQYTIGKGTPIPSVPTRRLVVVGPYKYSRNPMTFGSVLLYASIGLFFHSLAMILVILLIFLVPLSLYVKIIEEKELAARFGDEYARYKKRTRFMLPLPKRHGET